MSLHYYTYYSKEKIKVADKAFASGGEGVLYKIASPRIYRNKIAKIYHKSKKLTEVLPKIKYMIAQKTAGLSGLMAFPIDLILNNKKEFVGFVMSLFKGDKLEILCQPNLLKKLSHTWKRYDINLKQGLENRLHLGFFIASLLSKIHATKQYTVVDLKPENILVNSNMDIAMVDVDSMQITEGDKLLFRAPVVTMEYAPPEFHFGDVVGATSFLENWDNFSLAIILYRMFLQVHPYAASSQAPYDSIVNLHGKVENGLFVHHPNLQDSFKAVPILHRRFYELPLSLQKLFLRCFVDGHTDTSARPTALEWAVALMVCVKRYHNKDKMLSRLIVGTLPELVAKRIPIPSVAYEQKELLRVKEEYLSLVENGWVAARMKIKSFSNHQLKEGLNQGFWALFFIGFLVQLLRFIYWVALPTIGVAIDNLDFIFFVLLIVAAILVLGLGIVLGLFFSLYLGRITTSLLQTILLPLFYHTHPIVYQKKQPADDKIPIALYVYNQQELKAQIVLEKEQNQLLMEQEKKLYEDMVQLRTQANKRLDEAFERAEARLANLNVEYMSQASAYLNQENEEALVALVQTLQEEQYYQKVMEQYESETQQIEYKYKIVHEEEAKMLQKVQKELKLKAAQLIYLQLQKKTHLDDKEKIAINFEKITLQNYIVHLWTKL